MIHVLFYRFSKKYNEHYSNNNSSNNSNVGNNSNTNNNSNGFTIIYLDTIPQQHNSYDCGIYTLMYMKYSIEYCLHNHHSVYTNNCDNNIQWIHEFSIKLCNYINKYIQQYDASSQFRIYLLNEIRKYLKKQTGDKCL